MNLSNHLLLDPQIDVYETIWVPYNIGSINGSACSTLSPTSVRTTDMLVHTYLLKNTTVPEYTRQSLHNVTSRDYYSGRRGSPLDYSSVQWVSKQAADKVSFIFVMILIPCFSVFGAVGNVLSLRVLVHHRMRNTTNMVLAALSVSDLLFLLHAIFFSFLRLYALRNPVAGEQLRSLMFPVLGAYGSVVTARITTGMTTILSMERLVAVYFPMKAKVMCGKVMTMTCIVMIYLVTAVMFIPSALKYHSYYLTTNNQTKYTMGFTELGKNDLFYLIYGNILNILFRFIPLLIIMLVNILIALAIRRTWSFRRTMSNGGSKSYEQNRITLMLLMVSLVFLVCILPGAIHSIVDQVYKQYSKSGHQSNIYDIVRNVTYFLETVNSSVNFVIYMAFSTKFCRTYKQIFCCSKQAQVARSSKSIMRFSFRPQNGSRTSMTSYRELYLLHQFGNGKLPVGKDIACIPVNKNGFVANTNSVNEQGGKRIYRSKYSVSESHSNSQSGGHNSHSGGHNSHSGGHSSHSGGHSSHSGGHSSQGKGERYSEHSISSNHSVHSSNSQEPTAAEMYS